MDFSRNIPVPGGGVTSEYQPEQLPAMEGDMDSEWLSFFVEDCFCGSGNSLPLAPAAPSLPLKKPEQLLSSSTKLGSLEDLFSSHSTQEGDMGSEWLSLYVEECFSSSGNCLPSLPLKKPQQKYLKKARSQRKSSSSSAWSHSHQNNPLLDQITSDPPLFPQAHWLAESEPIFLKKETESGGGGQGGGGEEEGGGKEEEVVVVVEEEMGMGRRGSLEGSNNGRQPRMCSYCLAQRTPQWRTGPKGHREGRLERTKNGKRPQQHRTCSHCLSQRTPQWRTGPKGPKTLCNACGVMWYKWGGLLPEYRPANSPTFVSYMHSNFHRKVLEMRNSISLLLSSNS